MSQENVEVVEQAFRTFREDGVDAVAERYWSEDIEHRAIEGAIDDRGPLRGKAACKAYIADWAETFDDFRSEPVEIIDAEDEKVVAVIRISGRAKQSGVPASLTYALVYWLRNRKVVRSREYATREEALEAAGLRV